MIVRLATQRFLAAAVALIAFVFAIAGPPTDADRFVRASAPNNISPQWPNLLQNYSFEGTLAWENHADDAASPSGFVDTCGAIDGSQCLMIDDTENDGSEGWRSALISVAPRAEYSASAQVYRVSGHAPFVYLKYYNSAGTEVGSSHVEASSGTGAWQSISVTDAAPETATHARVLAYSISTRVGKSYFDQMQFTRADAQSYIDNQYFDNDATGAGQPVGWSDYVVGGEPFSVATDPVDANNHTLHVNDDSDTNAGYAATSFSAWSGTEYRISWTTYLNAGSDRTHGYLKFFDSSGTELSSTSVASESTTQAWQDVEISATAPQETAYATVLVGCIISFQCSAYFDDIEAWEDWTSKIMYVSAAGSGNKDGSDEANAAEYTDSQFWDGVDSALSTSPVQVIFLDGTYSISSLGTRLLVDTVGDSNHRLNLVGETRYGVLFETVAGFSGGTMLQFDDSTRFNVSFMHLRTSTSSSVPAGLRVFSTLGNPVEDVRIQGLTSRGMENLIYSSFSTISDEHDEGSVSNVLLTNSEFITGGGSSGYHHVYPSYEIQGLQIHDNYFEDSSGSFVKLRGAMTDTEVVGNHLALSDAWAATHTPPLVQLAVYGDVDPSHEWFGTGYTIQDNVLRVPSSCSTCTLYAITHQGYNPVDDTMTERDHLLDETKGDTLSDTSAGNIAARQAILANDFHLEVNDCSAGICTTGNVHTGTGYVTFKLWTKHAFGAEDQGGSGTYDITNLFSY